MHKKLIAEFIGTLFLVTCVIGSGIAASKLSPGNLGLELFENSFATGGGLVFLILSFGPISGAHFNPLVSLWALVTRRVNSREFCGYVTAQFLGGFLGALVANAMFSRATIELSNKVRSSFGVGLSEAVATFGLVMVIALLAKSGKLESIAIAVGCYIASAYFFTSSTSFANPAVTVARMFSNTFAGISPSSVPEFVGFQVVGSLCAILVVRVIEKETLAVQ